MQNQFQMNHNHLVGSSFQRIIVNEKSCNMLTMFENSRMNGKMIRNVTNVILYLFKYSLIILISLKKY